MVHLKDDWTNSFIEKRNASNKKSYKFKFEITEEHTKSALSQQSPPHAVNLQLNAELKDDGDNEEEEDEDDDFQNSNDFDEDQVEETAEESKQEKEDDMV